MARILLVDDEEPIRVSLSTYLQRIGHDVTVAGNGIEALRTLSKQPFDLVVTDVNMPDMDGIEVILKLREAASEIPLIVMSGGGFFDKELLLDSAGALGADVTLEKPIDLDELRSAIDSLI